MASVFDLQHQHDNTDSKIIAALERLSHVFRLLLWDKTKAYGLSPIQTQILVYLLFHQQKFATINDLAARFSLTPATISEAVKTLEQKGLVTRASGQPDRRATWVSLTRQGNALAESLADWADLLNAQLAHFDPTEKIIVMRFLMRLIEALQQAGYIKVARMCITCRFFRPGEEIGDSHYCTLLEKPLPEAALRLDCPDHQAVEG